MVDPHSVTLRAPPLPRSTGERKGAWLRPCFLSPGQGERWLPQADGVGVFQHRRYFFFSFAGATFFRLVATAISAALETFGLAASLPSCLT